MSRKEAYGDKRIWHIESETSHKLIGILCAPKCENIEKLLTKLGLALSYFPFLRDAKRRVVGNEDSKGCFIDEMRQMECGGCDKTTYSGELRRKLESRIKEIGPYSYC